MTRKHFIEAAEIIKAISKKKERERTAYRFATMFRKFNKRFDSAKFFRACNVK